MSRKSATIGIMGALAATMAIAPVAADAQYYGGDGYYGRPAPGPAYGGGGYDREGNRGGYGPRGYYARRHRCHSDGTTGTIIGAIAGGLLGNGIAGRGDRAAGTVIGGGIGAFAGRAIERDC